MNALDAMKTIAIKAGLTYATISKLLNKKRGYINGITARGSMPRIDTYVRILDVCGYGLYAISKDDAPMDAIQITVDDK